MTGGPMGGLRVTTCSVQGIELGPAGERSVPGPVEPGPASRPRPRVAGESAEAGSMPSAGEFESEVASDRTSGGAWSRSGGQVEADAEGQAEASGRGRPIRGGGRRACLPRRPRRRWASGFRGRRGLSGVRVLRRRRRRWRGQCLGRLPRGEAPGGRVEAEGEGEAALVGVPAVGCAGRGRRSVGGP